MAISEVLAEIAEEKGWSESGLLAAILLVLDDVELSGKLDSAISDALLQGVDAIQDD
jgi:hypothetical protein